MVNLFRKLDQGRPPVEKTTDPQRKGAPQIELLLDWLVNRWGRTTITVRQIRNYGPGPLRDKEVASRLAYALADQGWLIPIRGQRIDSRVWRIAGKLPAAPASDVADRSKHIGLPS